MATGSEKFRAVMARIEGLKDGDLLQVPVRPIGVSYPRPARRKQSVAKGKRKSKLKTALLWGDTHFPAADHRALAVVQAIAEDMQPDLLVHMGDLIDAADLSEKFTKNPARRETLQDEIDQARNHLATMRKTCPDAEFVLLEGNHEERMSRVLWNIEGPAAALAMLTNVRRELTWPRLLGLEELHIQHIPYKEQTGYELMPKWLLKHGNKVRSKSSYTAAAEHAHYGRSGASGHTHRLGMFFHRDHNGNHVWCETGCTTLLQGHDYTQDPDWQQGCVFLTAHEDSGAFQAEPVYIHEGHAVFRGVEYDARHVEP